MTDHKISLQTLLEVWRHELPPYTTMDTTTNENPDAVVIYAVRTDPRTGQKNSASAWISREAIEDFGEGEAVVPAMSALVKLAKSGGMPMVKDGEPAPMAVRMTSEGLQSHDPPIASPILRK